MELTLIGLSILASVILYKIGYKNGKEHGHTVGYSHGMFKANELINEKKNLEDAERNRKSFVGVKHRLAPYQQSSQSEPIWIG